MSAKIIDGEAVAKGILDAVRADVQSLKASGRPVHLFAVQVGENAASQVYIRNQQAACEEIGIDYTLDSLPAETTQKGLADRLGALNASADCTGIILQMPLPEAIDRRKAQAAIAPEKDVEGMNPVNMGAVLAGEPYIGPCTALGAVELAVVTLLPLAFGLLWTLGIMGWLGLPIDMMNCVFVIFIIGIGEDYSVFW